MPIKVTTLNDMVVVLLPIGTTGNHAPRSNEMYWTIPHFFDHGCLITVPFVSIDIVVNEVEKAGSTPHRHPTGHTTDLENTLLGCIHVV